MTEDKLKNLLKEADRNSGPPVSVKVNIADISIKAKRRNIIRIVRSSAAAAVLILGIVLWSLQNPTTEQEEKPPTAADLIAMQVEQLQESTDATVKFIQEILEQEQKQKRLRELEAELAAIPDPVEQINEELDRTAFILVYSADKMYNELNLTESAVETYKRVIKLFPQNQWAHVARQRLEEIKNADINKNRSQGDTQWNQQNQNILL